MEGENVVAYGRLPSPALDTHKHGKKEKLSIKKNFSANTCKIEIQKQLVNNQNLNKKVVFIVLI